MREDTPLTKGPVINLAVPDLDTLTDHHRRAWDNGLRQSWMSAFSFLDTTCVLMFHAGDRHKGYPSTLSVQAITSQVSRRNGRFKLLIQYLASMEVQVAIPVDRICVLEVVNRHLAGHMRSLGWNEVDAPHPDYPLMGASYWITPCDARTRYEGSSEVGSTQSAST